MARRFIEGLPCAGKSLLTKRIKSMGGSVVHELGRIIPSNNFPGNGGNVAEVLEIDDWFIQKEGERLTSSDTAYFDRSYLTHLAYAYAYGRYKGIPSLEATVQKYSQALNDNRLVMPEGIIYLEISPEESIQRQAIRIKMGSKALDNFWSDKSFLNDIEYAYQRLFDSIDNVCLLQLSGELSTEEKYAQVSAVAENHKNGESTIDLAHYVKRLHERADG